MTDPRKSNLIPSLLLGISLSLVPGLFACGDGGNGDPDPDPPRADSIALSPDSISFDALEDTVRVTAVVFDQYGDVMPDVSVVWASDDGTVARVDQAGLVTSVWMGQTEIRAQGGSERGTVSVEVEQEASALVAQGGDGQTHWTGYQLQDNLYILLTDGAGSPVIGAEVTWEVLEGDGTVQPEKPRTDGDGVQEALWTLGEGDSGTQRVSAKFGDLDPAVFEASGFAPITVLNAGALAAPMLDTVAPRLLFLDSLGVPASGIPVAFTGVTGFGELVQGPTASDINGELERGWALGPTPGPQELTVIRTDIGAELSLTAEATGVLDPWPFTTVAPGFYHTCAVDTDNSAYCWGLNDMSQLSGPADTVPVEVPTAVSGALSWEDIGGGGSHSCGLTTGGSIYCWGQGYQTGQPGDSTTIIPDPAQVGAGAYKTLSVGAEHTCGIKVDGTGWCWGVDLEGRLGNGSLDPTNTPTEIQGGFGWNQLSGGHFHTCGLVDTGDAYCWGQGTEGQLGDGGIDNQEAPVLVAGGREWIKISAGRFHSCAISTTQEAYCWGLGNFNQLGIGSTADQTSPALVSGGLRWTDIAAGQWHSCGVDTDEKLYCWGRGGSVGLGAFGAPTPAVILPAYDWESVQTRGIHTCAITTLGETYCWGGSNAHGELGIGNTDDFDVPRMVIKGVILP